MSKYDRATASKNQAQFSQTKPLNYCRKCRSNIELSRELIKADKIEHPLKCRDPRCSHECRINWSKKQSAVMNIFLRDDLPAGCTMYRGNLAMPKGAMSRDHADAKGAFLRSMRTWSNHKNCIFEVHGTLHITDPSNAHWDIIAYSNVSKTPLGKQVSAAWRKAGGKSHSLPLLDPDKVEAATKYVAKDEQVTIERKNNRRYLALPTRDIGINIVWYSASFFQGLKPKDLWRKQIKEWEAAGVFKRKPSKDCVPTLRPQPDAETPVQSPVQQALQVRLDALGNDAENGRKVGTQSLEAAEKKALLAELDRLESELPRRDASNVLAVLPDSLQDATEAASVGGWAEVPVKVARSILDTARTTEHGIVRVEAEGELRRYWGDGVPYMKPAKVISWYREPVEQVREDKGNRIVPLRNESGRPEQSVPPGLHAASRPALSTASVAPDAVNVPARHI